MKSKQTRTLLKDINRYRSLYLMILPAVISVFIFEYIPIYGVQIAFKDFRTKLGIFGSEWAGFKHFLRFFDYPYFWTILWNTIRISLMGLLFFPVPVIFAIMLNEMRDGKLKKTCQTITYAPHFISTVLVCSMTMLFLNRQGLFNIIGGTLFGDGYKAVDFMSNPDVFPWAYSLSGVWSELGWGTIIYIATLAGVSSELVEAAKIDGATRFQVIRHVYLPHLKPTIITMLILQIGQMLSVGFEKVFLLQNPLNMEVSNVISTYVYEVGIGMHEYSYSTAIGLFNSVINIILILTANAVSKKVADSGLW
jgi:putative aldouronate transport system permease protein